MIQWRDDVDFEKAAVQALVQNGLSVRANQKQAEKRLIVRDGDTIKVKCLPRDFKLNRSFFGKRRRMFIKSTVGRNAGKAVSYTAPSFYNAEQSSLHIPNKSYEIEMKSILRYEQKYFEIQLHEIEEQIHQNRMNLLALRGITLERLVETKERMDASHNHTQK